MNDTSLTIAQVIEKVKLAIISVTKDARFDQNLSISKVELTLLVVSSNAVGGEVKPGLLQFIPFLKEFGASGKVAEEQLTILKLTLQREAPTLTLQSSSFIETLEDQLREGILSICDGVRGADQGPVGFSLADASIELKFQLTATGKMSILVVSGELGSQKSHTLTLRLVKRN